MNTTLRIVIALLAGGSPGIFAADPAPHETSEKIFIVVQEQKGIAKELPLDKSVIKKVSEMMASQQDPYLAMAGLTIAGLDCCPPTEKLSDTVWKCCDGTKTIITNNASVAKILATTHELKRADWEKYKEQKSIMAGDLNILNKLLDRKPNA